MHEIEPFYNWRDYYIAAEDKLSPFHGRNYSEFEFENKIYNHYIHPQWDFFGSSTLYCKLLFADYETGVAVIELIGEWNDTLHSDVMELKRNLVDPLIEQGIIKFILIGENILNFHASDELYYEEWLEDIKEEGGWIICLNFREHVTNEMQKARIHYYLHMGDRYNHVLWRKLKPTDFAEFAEHLLLRSIE